MIISFGRNVTAVFCHQNNMYRVGSQILFFIALASNGSPSVRVTTAGNINGKVTFTTNLEGLIYDLAVWDPVETRWQNIQHFLSCRISHIPTTRVTVTSNRTVSAIDKTDQKCWSLERWSQVTDTAQL